MDSSLNVSDSEHLKPMLKFCIAPLNFFPLYRTTLAHTLKHVLALVHLPDADSTHVD
jgi:hypothetical protein